jgi:hypothetical protein
MDNPGAYAILLRIVVDHVRPIPPLSLAPHACARR